MDYSGNSVVIYKDGKKVFEYSSGYSDLEKKIKKTGESSYIFIRVQRWQR